MGAEGVSEILLTVPRILKYGNLQICVYLKYGNLQICFYRVQHTMYLVFRPVVARW